MAPGYESDTDRRLSPLLSPVDFPPASAKVTVEFGADSRPGRYRSANEDHYLVLRLGRHQETLMTSLPDHEAPKRFDEFGYGMVIADGMGGTGAGEVASRLAIATLVHLALHFGKWNLRIDDQIAREVIARAERFYRDVDGTLVRESRAGSTSALKTTLTAAYSAGRDLFVAHVGHSRAYLLRDPELVQLTRDHTLAAQRRGTTGLLDLAGTARDLQHILTETMGATGAAGPRVEIGRLSLVDGDVVLLCTNGLTDGVGEDRIAAVLGSDRAPAHQCRTLVNLAVDAGGEDDVTALVARYRIPE